MITESDRQFYDENGYVIVRQMFSPAEIVRYRDHYMAMRAEGPKPGDYGASKPQTGDPLNQFPRMINMHLWDESSLQWLLDERLRTILTELAGSEPYAVQTMLYFKPPQSRGQALHQDNWYLRAQPGTCIAAWLALDDCDEANGCLQVVPGSNHWPLLCEAQADTHQSFTSNTVAIPPTAEVRPMLMAAGDVLFFHGSAVHGSFPNLTTDRFRRALIGHYIEGDVTALSKGYKPILRFDGSEVKLAATPDGGLCGTWVTKDGTPVVEYTGVLGALYKGLE